MSVGRRVGLKFCAWRGKRCYVWVETARGYLIIILRSYSEFLKVEWLEKTEK